jgi:hypothetical protein
MMMIFASCLDFALFTFNFSFFECYISP